MNETPILVSIIVPVYNVEKYLDVCLWSLRNQTYSHLEIIVVDDKSPDHSVQIAQKHAQEDSRIKILYHEENKMLGAARNTGICYASGKYIMFLDADDSYPLDAVNHLLHKIEDVKADMVIGAMSWINQPCLTPVEYVDNFIKRSALYDNTNLKNLPAEKWFLGHVGNRIYRSDWLKKWNIKFDEGIYWEDLSFSVNTWYHAQSIHFTSKIVYFILRRDDIGNPSITQDYSRKKYIDRDFIEESIIHILEKECRKNPSTKHDAEILIDRIFANTKSILPKRNVDIAEWVDLWFVGYNERHLERLKNIEQL